MAGTGVAGAGAGADGSLRKGNGRAEELHRLLRQKPRSQAAETTTADAETTIADVAEETMHPSRKEEVAMRKFSVGLGLAVLLASGCGLEPIYSETFAVETEGGWSATDVKTFQFEVEDTLRQHEFFIDLRHDQDYPFSNLYLFVDFEFPNGRVRRDTVLCELADARGVWHGTGTGPLVDHRIGIQTHTAFPLSGAYEVNIQHAMRRDPLPGIRDVGFRLELTPGQD